MAVRIGLVLVCVLALSAACIVACTEGLPGSQGPQGPPGPQGPAGDPADLSVNDPIPVLDHVAILVEAGTCESKRMQLDAGVRFEGFFTIDGGGNDVDFWIEDPDGNVILWTKSRPCQNHSFAFVAATDGEYILFFDNRFSLVTHKMVVVSGIAYPSIPIWGGN